MTRVPQTSGADGKTPHRVAKQSRMTYALMALLMLISGAALIFGEQMLQLEFARPALAGIMLVAAVYAFYLGSRQGSALSVDRPDHAGEHLVAAEKPHKSANRGMAARGAGSQKVQLSYTDRTTGLGNKLRLQEKFKNLAQECKAGKIDGFAVGIANLDGMKSINDLYGHNGGDQLLEQCGMRLRNTVEPFGFVFRHDDDRFAFIIPGIVNEGEVDEIGKLLQEVLNAPFDIDGTPVRISGSFGFAVYPHAGENLDKLSGCIETALYQSKRQGRGRITVYSPEIEEAVRENAVLEQALRQAISEGSISPHFQPIISLEDGCLLGFESLARWIDPGLGFVSPARFIPLAEERGIITELTEQLLLKAAEAAVEWPDGLFLSFNLSSAQLVDPSTAQSILKIIHQAGLPARRLEIEVTETAIMSDPQTAARIIEELHDAGIRVSMDDFGTGQSSLGRLRELKLDKVKIDRAFVMEIGEDKSSEHIVRAIVEMCAGLNLKVVAEGIENIAQAEVLKKFGCDAGQGFLFGKPQDASRTMGYIHEFRRISEGDPSTRIA